MRCSRSRRPKNPPNQEGTETILIYLSPMDRNIRPKNPPNQEGTETKPILSESVIVDVPRTRPTKRALKLDEGDSDKNERHRVPRTRPTKRALKLEGKDAGPGPSSPKNPPNQEGTETPSWIHSARRGRLRPKNPPNQEGTETDGLRWLLAPVVVSQEPAQPRGH